MAPPVSSAKTFPRLSQHGSWEDAAKAYAEVAFLLAQRLGIVEGDLTDVKAYALAAMGLAQDTKRDMERVRVVVEHMARSMGIAVPIPGADALALVDASGQPMRERAVSHNDFEELRDQVEELRDRPTPAVAFVVPGMPGAPPASEGRKEMNSERVRGEVRKTLEQIEHEEEKKVKEVRAKRREEIVTDIGKKLVWFAMAGGLGYLLSHFTWH